MPSAKTKDANNKRNRDYNTKLLLQMIWCTHRTRYETHKSNKSNGCCEKAETRPNLY